MSENDRRQRTISSTPRLTPDEVASRSFATAFRGISEPDVRAFLKRVSEELAMVRTRELELAATVDELEGRLRSPRPLDEQELLDALGEETTRLLRSAREAATDIRGKAEERASKLVHDAHEDAKRVRQEATEVLGVRTHEAESVAHGLLEEAEQRAGDLMRVAEERAAEMRDSAEHHASDLRARVEREAAIEIEDARERALALVEEATNLRERIIDDLARRRELLTGQLEELRAGRDRLLDSYRVVKRTFLDATTALAQVEAKASAGRAVTGPDPADLSDAVAAEGDAARAAGLEAPVAGEAVVEEAVEEAVEDPSDQVDADTAEPTGDSVVAAAAAEGATTNLDDVDDLFARLRAGAVVETEAGTVSADAEATPPSGEPEPQPAAPTAAEAAPAELSDPAASPAAANAETGEPEPAPDEVNLVDEAPGWLSQRDEALAPLRVTLVRQVKLAIGNEQNEVLDKVRRQKGKAVAADVLPDLDAQTAQWAAVVSTTASEAYRLARSADGGDAGAAPDDLAPTLARSMVEPLRERVVAAIDGAHEPGETSAQVAERIGARYREWKNRAAEASSEDVLVAAWARGRFDAAGDGAMLNWSTPPAGCCPDCADNVLEPTLKGENFPTGQPYPPAHPGCRCGVTTAAPASVAGESVGARSNGGDSNHPI